MIELIEIGKIEKIGTLRSFKGKFMDDLNRTYELVVYGTEHSIQLYKKEVTNMITALKKILRRKKKKRLQITQKKKLKNCLIFKKIFIKR